MNSFWAYIDPFTGGIILQVLVASFVGILVFFKKIKYAVLNLLCGKNRDENNAAAEPVQRKDESKS